jgi:ATP-dependent Zn protease
MDRTITIERPDVDELRNIFRFYLKNDLSTEDLMPLALAARGGTGADVEAWVRRARSRARRGDRTLAAADILHEIAGQHTKLPHDLRNVVCIHESGHIVVGAALRCYEPTMVWLSETGGLTSGEMNLGNDVTLRGMENIITTLLGGRAAEKLLLGVMEVTIGAGLGDNSDLMRATQIAFDIETRFGLGQAGLV